MREVRTMTGRSIIEKIEEKYPVSLAEEWDNVGLLVGDPDREVNTVLVALDLTDETLELAAEAGADLIVTHHPMLFKPVSRVTALDRTGRRILALAERRISCYAAHTNFDVAGMAALNAADLGLENDAPLEVTGLDENDIPFGLGRIGDLKEAVTAGALAEKVKEICGLDAVRLYGPAERLVRRAAVCGGSGKSLIGDAIREGAEVFVTGDLDYHSAIDAVSDGLILIDAGHYGTEKGFIACMAETIREFAPDLAVIEAPVKQPYTVV